MSVLTPAQFLTELYQPAKEGYAEIRLIHFTGDISQVKKMWRPLPVGEIRQSGLDKLSELNSEYHIYHRVAISNQKRSKKPDITALTALWLEVDDTSAEAVQRLLDMANCPNIILASGGGYHAYWLLKEPHYIGSLEDRQEVERTLQGMIVAYGDGADPNCKDITRILRTPGFYNIKAKYGPDKPLAQVMWFDDLNIRYRFSSLHNCYAPLGAPPRARITRYIPAQAYSQDLPKWVCEWLQNPHIKNKGRNHTLYVLARAYLDAGQSQGRAESDLIPLAQSLSGDHPLTANECMNTVASAYRNQANRTNQLPRHMSQFMAIEDTLQGAT